MYNELAELNVIGSILLGGRRTFQTICGKLKPEHFYCDLYRDSYKIISEIQFRDDNIDLPVLKDKLVAKGYTEHEIDQSLVRGMECVVSVENVEGNSNSIIGNYKRREADRLCRDATRELHADCIDEQLTELASGLSELARDGGHRKAKSTSEMVASRFEEYFKPRDPRTVFLGYEQLDRIINGIDPTDYAVLAARPGIGKTTFAMNIAKKAAEKGQRPIIFTLEMSKDQIIDKYMSMLSGVSLSVIRAREQIHTHEQTAKALAAAAEKLSKLDILVDDDVRTPRDIINAISKVDVGLIIVDYLQLMKGSGKTENRTQEVSDISRELRLLSLRKEIPMITISQLSRASELRQNKRPVMSDLRESGAIEQDATQIFFLSEYEKLPNGNGIYVDVAKCRLGDAGIGSVFRFYKETGEFEETKFRYDDTTQTTTKKQYRGMD